MQGISSGVSMASGEVVVFITFCYINNYEGSQNSNANLADTQGKLN